MHGSFLSAGSLSMALNETFQEAFSLIARQQTAVLSWRRAVA